MPSRVVQRVTFSLQLFGGIALTSSRGRPNARVLQRRRLALLAVLAAGHRTGVTRDRLIGLLWPEVPDDRARRLLSDSLYVLRQGLGNAALVATANAVRLDSERVVADVIAFERAADEADLEHAAGLYAGPFLEGFQAGVSADFERWVDGERARLARRAMSVIDALVADAEGAGERQRAAEWLRRRVALDPYDAAATLRLVRALEAADDPTAALRVARAYETRMREELEVDPSPQIAAEVQRLRAAAHLPGIAARDTSSVDVRSAVAGTGGGTERLAASLAVLPFVNLSGDEETETFCDGITEELTSVLSCVPGLRVAARTSAMAFKGRGEDMRRVGERLGVATMLESSVRRAGSRLRLTVQLIDAADGCHRWARSYDATLTSMIDVQDELAREIADHLRLTFVGIALPARARPRNEAAYAAYLRGVHHTWAAWSQPGAGLARAVEQFEEALRHDPDYAAAYSGLASAYLNLAANQNYSTADANRRARAAATRALSLDPSLADAHAAIGLVLLFADWDWDGSARAVARALEINPNHAGAHLQRAWWLAFRGRGREAIQENARAWELDPLSPATGGFYAYTLYWSGEMERAVTQSRHVLDLDPNSAFAHQVLGLSLFALGDGHGARRELDTAVALFPQHAFLVACRGWIYAHTGGTDEAILAVSALDALADNGGPGSAPEIVGTAAAGLAMLHGALGDLNTAVERLLLAERLRSSYVLAMHVYPGLRALCRDERVAALATRVGLPPTKASS